MTDPDFASFGEPNRSRPEGYRLTHPRNEQATGSTNGLTGFDPGRGSLGRPEVAVGWTPADSAPEWATGGTPSVAPESHGSAGPGMNGHFPPSSNGSTFSAFDAPAAREPRSANPPPRMPHTESAPTASNTPSPTTEFSAPRAPEPSNPVPDPAFRTDAEPAGQSSGLPRRTPGLPHRFTDSDETDYAYSQPIVNLLDSQFDSPSAARRDSGGSGSLTNGSAYTSAESGPFTDNSLSATAERDIATTTDAPPNSTEFGSRTSTPTPAPAPLPERSARAARPETNSSATDPISNSTAPGASAERAPRTRTGSGLTAPDSTDAVDAATPPAPASPRSRMSRKAAERAAAAEAASTTTPDDENPSGTTSPGAAPLLRTRTAEPRRSTPQDDATKNVDVHLIMHLLLASHTLENIADKAEAGDVSLEEFIRAARRTRTAAVDLVSTWFGGADQMRQFAEALLAASGSA